LEGNELGHKLKSHILSNGQLKGEAIASIASNYFGFFKNKIK
jgi:hypothetical protein